MQRDWLDGLQDPDAKGWQGEATARGGEWAFSAFAWLRHRCAGGAATCSTCVMCGAMCVWRALQLGLLIDELAELVGIDKSSCPDRTGLLTAVVERVKVR